MTKSYNHIPPSAFCIPLQTSGIRNQQNYTFTNSLFHYSPFSFCIPREDSGSWKTNTWPHFSLYFSISTSCLLHSTGRLRGGEKPTFCLRIFAAFLLSGFCSQILVDVFVTSECIHLYILYFIGPRCSYRENQLYFFVPQCSYQENY